MFSNIKKKLNSALQEGLVISESLQQHYTQRVSSSVAGTSSTLGDFHNRLAASSGSESSTTTNPYGSCDLGLPPGLNLAAGCKLLAKYEDDWKAIHDANEENGQKAAKIAEQIETLEKRTSAQRTAITDLITCLSGIPALVEKLNASMEVLQEVQKLNYAAESKLEQLESICEECELQDFMLQKEYELSQYKQRKMAELEVYRQKLAAEHEEKIRQHEARWQRIQRERQAVFDDVFRSDMAEFKQKGTLTKLDYRDTSRDLALEEVDLADIEPQDALEEFLKE